MVIRLGRVVAYRRKTSHTSQVTFWSSNHVAILKPYIYTSTIRMATKLGRVVTYGWKIQPTKSCDLLIAWSLEKWKILKLPSCKTWNLQIWQSINLMLQDPTNQVMWSFDHVVTLKIKKFLFAFQQNLWQPNLAEQRLRVGDTIPEVKWTFNQVVMWSLFVKCF